MTQPPPATPPFSQYPAPPPARRPGPGLGISLTFVGTGVVIAVVSVVLIVLPLLGAFTSSVYDIPGELHVHLHHARYTVYQHSGTRSGLGESTLDPPAVKLDPSVVSVTAPGGIDVPVADDVNNESVTRGSAVYTGAVEFEAPASGDYVLRFTNVEPTRVIVARSFRDAIQSVLVWFVTGAIGTAVLVAGIVMLIVGATRRGRARRAMYAMPGPWGGPGYQQPYPPSPYGPPPGYPGYPPPGAPPTDPPPPGPANPWDPPPV